nr:hypothetical protein [Mesomycoplasma hyopneumoniae]
MKLAKFKKIILLLMFWPSIFLIYHSFLINFNTKKYWYASNFSNKIDIREPFAKQLSNSPKIDDFDNQFELKLLLNPNFVSTESKEISNFNLEFIRLKFKKAKMDKHKNDFDKWSKTHINSERLNLEATKKIKMTLGFQIMICICKNLIQTIIELMFLGQQVLKAMMN